MTPSWRALVVGLDDAAVVPGDRADEPFVGSLVAAREVVDSLDPTTRWVMWSARDLGRWEDHPTLGRAWDVSEVHRLIHGGWRTGPALAWAAVHGLALDGVPPPPADDLFDLLDEDLDAEALVRRDGYLRPDAVAGRWMSTPDRLLVWGRAALDVAARQAQHLAKGPPRHLAAAHAESAAAVLAVELTRTGLPIDRGRAEELITASAGPRPTSLADELETRAARDAVVLGTVPGAGRVDLRNPEQVRTLLARVGVDVSSTRRWVLEAHRDTHPLVPALLRWRKEERIATTYGWRWLAEHVGPDDRLRGEWAASDGAAGRMTAQAGLHNLPAELRPAVVAAPGHVFVRADLGQVEPRVLAAVSGDVSFAAATTAADLYAPVAERLGVPRDVAKIAVLAAMYGQRSGAAGEALAGLERAYPVAMRHLDQAYEQGRRGEPVRTFGGRLVRTGGEDEADPAVRNGRGRFARNAVIQGSAAELFKAWAATVRATTRELEAEIVLCLHDELLVHVPERHAQACADAVDRALTDASRRWLGGEHVRFVADTSVVRCWADVP